MFKKFVEDDKTELKSVLNEKLEKEVVSFLNSKSGGDIYIGVTDDGTVLVLTVTKNGSSSLLVVVKNIVI